jgi:hypothetical protein
LAAKANVGIHLVITSKLVNKKGIFFPLDFFPMTLKVAASMYFNLPDGCAAEQTVTIFHLMFAKFEKSTLPLRFDCKQNPKLKDWKYKC